MRILLLTPGTGSFICGSCSRDNTLSAALKRKGHAATIVPLYLPFELENQQDSPTSPQLAEQNKVRMGGINVFLQQKLPMLAYLPRFLRNWLDAEWLLRLASTMGDMTNPEGLGEMTISMLRGEEGRQATEITRLLSWLKFQSAPDVILLSNAMLIGLARRLRSELNVPVICTLQGEQPFLDALHPLDSKRSWTILRERAQEVERFIAVSHYTAEMMGARLGLDAAKVQVVHNGIDLHGYEPADKAPELPTIGFLARMCTEKGLPALVEAFLQLLERGKVPQARLVIVGVQLSEDRQLMRDLQARCNAAGAADCIEFHPNVTRAEKIEHLRSFSLLSVPATYGESFGLYLIEAMACGVPVVQPDQAGFSEVLEATGGGLLYDPEHPNALVSRLEELLLNPELALELGQRGRAAVLSNFNADRMASEVAAVCAGLLTDRAQPSATMVERRCPPGRTHSNSQPSMSEDPAASNRANPLLRLEGVAKSFASPGSQGSSLPVLRSIDLELSRGESLAIVGPSGSGKSTLLNIIGTLEVPDAGRVLWQGREQSALNQEELAEFRNSQIGFVFQHHHLLPQCSALENVLLPTLALPGSSISEGAHARAHELLKRVGLGDRCGHHPAELSGGERQRVAVVRALINKPALLLADEPTGSLDADSASALGDLLVQLNQEEGLALVLVTHSMQLAQRMQRQLELQAGALISAGADR